MAARKGTKQVVKGHLYGRFWLGGEKRESVPMPAIDPTDDAAVHARCEVIADLSGRLIDAGRSDRARDFAVLLGQAKGEKRIANVLAQAQKVIASGGKLGAGITVKDFGKRWTGGDLAKMHPDHVRKKSTSDEDAQLFADYVYPVIGPMAVRLVQLEDCERVMARLPHYLSVARRRHVAQAMGRLFSLAVWPAKIIKSSPLPRGFLPKLGKPKAKQYLYPDEDATLMGCEDVPIVYRLFYGVMDREGPRFEEGQKLAWTDLDLERGVLRLDKNKTDDPRAWALNPSVVRALKKWKEMRPDLGRPFAEIPGDQRQAKRLREHVTAAGIEREGLLKSTENSMRLRFHDLRATFVTVSLANGKSETWVSDRTGHKSSEMIAKYRRAARTLSELNLGELRPLDEVIVWREKCAGQTDVKRSGKRARRVRAKGALAALENASGAEGGTRTPTPFRTADFESHSANRAPSEGRVTSKRDSAAERHVTPFDSGLTASVSAFDTHVERDLEVGRRLRSGVEFARAGDEAGSDENLRELATLVGGGAA